MSSVNNSLINIHGKKVTVSLSLFFKVDEDEPLFMSLIADLFPGIVLDSASYAELQVAITNQVEAAGLINHPSWNLKLVQVCINEPHHKSHLQRFKIIGSYNHIA